MGNLATVKYEYATRRDSKIGLKTLTFIFY